MKKLYLIFLILPLASQASDPTVFDYISPLGEIYADSSYTWPAGQEFVRADLVNNSTGVIEQTIVISFPGRRAIFSNATVDESYVINFRFYNLGFEPIVDQSTPVFVYDGIAPPVNPFTP